MWALELCYNVRHFEYHGRQLDDPWSCRQSAIYHKYELLNGTSNWIIIQHARSADISRETKDRGKLLHPMGLHVRFISALCESWRQYFDYLAGRLKDCVSIDLLTFRSSGGFSSKKISNLVKSER